MATKPKVSPGTALNQVTRVGSAGTRLRRGAGFPGRSEFRAEMGAPASDLDDNSLIVARPPIRGNQAGPADGFEIPHAGIPQIGAHGTARPLPGQPLRRPAMLAPCSASLRWCRWIPGGALAPRNIRV